MGPAASVITQNQQSVAMEEPTTDRPFLVRDLTGSLGTTYHATREKAEAWVHHLTEWRPNARPVIEKNETPVFICQECGNWTPETQRYLTPEYGNFCQGCGSCS